MRRLKPLSTDAIHSTLVFRSVYWFQPVAPFPLSPTKAGLLLDLIQAKCCLFPISVYTSENEFTRSECQQMKCNKEETASHPDVEWQNKWILSLETAKDKWPALDPRRPPLHQGLYTSSMTKTTTGDAALVRRSTRSRKSWIFEPINFIFPSTSLVDYAN